MKLNLPLWAQIGANLLSLVLALVMGWDPVLMLFLFWMENVIIGLWQIPRFLTADGNQPGSQLQRLSGALFKAGFFTVHYGLFTFIHGSLLFELFLKQSLDWKNWSFQLRVSGWRCWACSSATAYSFSATC